MQQLLPSAVGCRAGRERERAGEHQWGELHACAGRLAAHFFSFSRGSFEISGLCGFVNAPKRLILFTLIFFYFIYIYKKSLHNGPSMKRLQCCRVIKVAILQFQSGSIHMCEWAIIKVRVRSCIADLDVD